MRGMVFIDSVLDLMKETVWILKGNECDLRNGPKVFSNECDYKGTREFIFQCM